jgi:hypothetical protein
MLIFILLVYSRNISEAASFPIVSNMKGVSHMKIIKSCLFLFVLFFVFSSSIYAGTNGLLTYNSSVDEWQGYYATPYNFNAWEEVTASAASGEDVEDMKWLVTDSSSDMRWATGWNATYVDQPTWHGSTFYQDPYEAQFIMQADGSWRAD